MRQQYLESTLTVYGVVVFPIDTTLLHDVHALSFCDGTDLREREENLRTLHHRGSTFLVQEADESLTRLQVHNSLVGLEGRVGAERVSSRLHRFLVFRGIGTEGMLHTVTQLSEDVLWNIGRTLCDKIDTHSLRAYQTDDLLYLVEQSLRGVGEEHVCLVEEEHEFRLGQVTHLWEGGV